MCVSFICSSFWAGVQSTEFQFKEGSLAQKVKLAGFFCQNSQKLQDI